VVVVVVVVVVVAVAVVVVQKMKVCEKDDVKIVAVEMRVEQFYFIINNKRIMYKLKSLNFSLKQGD